MILKPTQAFEECDNAGRKSTKSHELHEVLLGPTKPKHAVVSNLQNIKITRDTNLYSCTAQVSKSNTFIFIFNKLKSITG